MKHNHNHSCSCEHNNVAYCKSSRTVYCKDCNQEWTAKYTWAYNPYTYTTIGYPGDGGTIGPGNGGTIGYGTAYIKDYGPSNIDNQLNDGHTSVSNTVCTHGA